MNRKIVSLLSLMLVAACGVLEVFAPGDGDPAQAAENDVLLVVRTGTQFGFCQGYCSSELRIQGQAVVYTQSSPQPDRYPSRTRHGSIGQAEWEEIAALASGEAFARSREVYGCPDCADGGAEWIEVEQDGKSKRVTFEHGADVPEIGELVRKLRAIRARFG